ncbi:MAG: hypothetical protein IJD06_03520 [Clostridia bacterium]|nr:hypothetical protein [Clostridia bacterium]
MSATGTKIFSHDMAMDVKSDFVTLFGLGRTVEEAEDYILTYRPEDGDEECCAFWSALARIEWEYGVLSDRVKTTARFILQNHSDAPLFLREKDRFAREAELQNLLGTLDTDNPAPKKRRKSFIYRTDWKEGDIYALPVGEKFVYLHICSVTRSVRKFEELQEDTVFVRVFDRVSDAVLTEADFRPRLLRPQKYRVLDPGRDSYAEMIWCNGSREQAALEKKLIRVGNLPVRRETNQYVHACFQFCKLEKTLSGLFEIPE